MASKSFKSHHVHPTLKRGMKQHRVDLNEKRQSVRIRPSQSTYERLKAEAHRRDTSINSLVVEWIEEKLGLTKPKNSER